MARAIKHLAHEDTARKAIKCMDINVLIFTIMSHSNLRFVRRTVLGGVMKKVLG
jgi:hypothetical protein